MNIEHHSSVSSVFCLQGEPRKNIITRFWISQYNVKYDCNYLACQQVISKTAMILLSDNQLLKRWKTFPAVYKIVSLGDSRLWNTA